MTESEGTRLGRLTSKVLHFIYNIEQKHNVRFDNIFLNKDRGSLEFTFLGKGSATSLMAGRHDFPPYTCRYYCEGCPVAEECEDHGINAT